MTHLFSSYLPGQLGGRQEQQRVANGRQLVPGGSGSAGEQLKKPEEKGREGSEEAHLSPFQQAQRHGVSFQCGEREEGERSVL